MAVRLAGGLQKMVALLSKTNVKFLAIVTGMQLDVGCVWKDAFDSVKLDCYLSFSPHDVNAFLTLTGLWRR